MASISIKHTKESVLVTLVVGKYEEQVTCLPSDNVDVAIFMAVQKVLPYLNPDEVTELGTLLRVSGLV